MPTLIEPSSRKQEAFASMAQDWRDHGVDRYGLALDDFAAYLTRLARLADPAQTRGRVPGTELWLEEQEQIVAVVRVRFWLTPELEVEGGHIGYDVRPSARRRGFGTAALELGLHEARRRGIDRARLTVDADNAASVAIIERCGGVLSGEMLSPASGKPIKQYWIALPR